MLALLLAVGPAMGMPPLALIQKENLGAAEILIGQVEEVKAAPPGIQKPASGGPERPQIFTLRLWHVVKSQAGAKPGGVVRVLCAGGPAAVAPSPTLSPRRPERATSCRRRASAREPRSGRAWDRRWRRP